WVHFGEHGWNRAGREPLARELVFAMAVWHARVDGDAGCRLDLRRILDALVHRLPGECGRDARDKAEEERQRQHESLLRADGLERPESGIEDAHIPNGAGLHDLQLLRLVDEQEVELGCDLGVAIEAHGL